MRISARFRFWRNKTLEAPIIYPFTFGSVSNSIYGSERYGKQRYPFEKIGSGPPQFRVSIARTLESTLAPAPT